ncbi:MAG: rRNA maturation RNase YbeY [Candidatus Schekmanbacteria bacterium]|nr:rRNA maturation RNase YbeY [Candidatus Schekmanbacteria bacterium]
MPVYIRNKQKQQKIQTNRLKQVLRNLLKHLGKTDVEVSVLLADDAYIRKLNLQYRQKDAPTDVLSFPQQEGMTPDAINGGLLGDIVVSIPTAGRQADAAGHPLERELIILLIHGLLHLLGYDHIKDHEAAVMEAKERELFSLVAQASCLCVVA